MSTAYEDRSDIVDLCIRYATSVDTLDWALFRTCFTPDCRIDYGALGSWDDLESFVTALARMSGGGGRRSLHRVSNATVSVTGDTATCRSYVDAVAIAADGTSGIHIVATYDDVAVRTDDGWRIAGRRSDSYYLGAMGA